MKKLLIFLCFQMASNLHAQNLIVGFYNCENFYDTIDQRITIDEEFLPNSNKNYTKAIFENKLKKLARTIFALGKIEKGDGLALLGLAEIENKNVLKLMLEDPLISKYHYQIIHFDSKDPRGIDVALIYSPGRFTPFQYKSLSLAVDEHVSDYPTRDILYVKGKLDNQWVHVFVNHWPSRRGGIKASNQRRFWASQVLKKQIDSLQNLDKNAFIITMGDFNDNPIDKSIQNLPLYNPFLMHFQRGDGTLAYGDSWHLFDQILVNKSLLLPKNNITIYKSIIYKNNSMAETQGAYRGYPKRTWKGDQYNHGYSDHYPVALILSLNIAENPVK